MSLSIQKMVSDGTLSTIVLGVQYLQRNDMYMRIAGVETPQSGAPSGYTWSFIDNNTIRVLPVVPVGVEVVVYRRTDLDAMYNIYSQNAQFDESTIDENNQQLLYIAQEYFEQGVPAQLIDSVEYVREDTANMYYRLKLSDGSYTAEFPVPKGGAAGFDALRRTYLEAGLNLVVGSFETGGVLSTTTDVLLHNVTAKAYAWSGAFPVGGKIVAPGSTPTPLGSGGWIDRSDVALRNDLLSGALRVRDGLFALRDIVSVSDFGAVGDGVTDDTAAIQAALDASDSVFVPAGKYLCSSDIIINVDNDRAFIGCGIGVANLIFTSGGLRTSFGNFSTPRSLTLSGLTLLSKQTGGTAITLERHALASIESAVILRDLVICGFSGVHSETHYWAKGISISDLRFVSIDNVRLWGRENNTTQSDVGIYINRDAASSAQFGYTLTNFWISSFRYGLKVNGNIEGFYCSGGEIWNAYTPVTVDRTGATLAGTFEFTNLHLNSKSDCVYLRNTTVVQITNCEMYHGVSGATDANIINAGNITCLNIHGSKISSAFYATKIVRAIRAVDCVEVLINSNLIRNFTSEGVSLGGVTYAAIVSSNILKTAYAGSSSGVTIESTCTNIAVGINKYVGVSNPVVDSSGAALIKYNEYSGSKTVQLTGGAPYELISIPIPVGMFAKKPVSAFAAISTTSGEFLVAGYAFDEAANSATNCVITVRTLNGANITAATRRFSFLINGL